MLPEIDPDIRRARTLPGRFYRDEGLFEAQVDRLFAQSWQWLADIEGLDEPGRVRPENLLPGCLDEPLVLSRDLTGRLRCFSNICTHRANPVVTREGRHQFLRCGYHGRCFELDGRFRSMPGFEAAEDFPGPEDSLAPLNPVCLGPMVFVGLQAVMDFHDWLAPVRQRLPWFDFDGLEFAPDRSRDYQVEAHWALYCENFLEGFHIPYVHPGLDSGLAEGGYHTERLENGVLQIGQAAPGEPAFDLPDDSPEAGQSIAGFYFWLFPNLMLNFYPWGLSLNQVIPETRHRTRVRFRSYVADPARLDQGAGGDLHQVELEDEAVVEAVHRGVQSRLYDRGRYSPEHEVGVHHFHRLLVRALGSRDDSAPE